MALRSRRFQRRSLISTAIARRVCHRIYCRRNAISSARTPTNEWTNPAFFTPNGWSPIKNRPKNQPRRKNQRRVTPANKPFFCRGGQPPLRLGVGRSLDRSEERRVGKECRSR